MVRYGPPRLRQTRRQARSSASIAARQASAPEIRMQRSIRQAAALTQSRQQASEVLIAADRLDIGNGLTWTMPPRGPGNVTGRRLAWE